MPTITIKTTSPLSRESFEREGSIDNAMAFNRRNIALDLAKKLVDAGYVSIEHLVTRGRDGGSVETTATLNVVE